MASDVREWGKPQIDFTTHSQLSHDSECTSIDTFATDSTLASSSDKDISTSVLDSAPVMNVSFVIEKSVLWIRLTKPLKGHNESDNQTAFQLVQLIELQLILNVTYSLIIRLLNYLFNLVSYILPNAYVKRFFIFIHVIHTSSCEFVKLSLRMIYGLIRPNIYIHIYSW